MPRYQLSESEISTNLTNYGVEVPWNYVSCSPVYTVAYEDTEGKSIQFRRLCTLEHQFEDETSEYLSTKSEEVFVFHEDWPIDDVLFHDGEFHQPFHEF